MRTIPLICLLAASISAQAFEQNYKPPKVTYEWKDPATGARKSSDKPPADAVYRVIFEETPKPANRDRHYVMSSERLPVRVGMTADNALEAWGQPDTINRTIFSSGTREQWVYGLHGAPGTQEYIYLDNGIVTAIQD